MSHGLRVWNESGQLRLDTNDKTLRLTDMIRVGNRNLQATQTISQFVSIAGFDPSVDGVFLNPGEPGYLWYEVDNYSGYQHMPDIAPRLGGVNLTWRGHTSRWMGAVRYMSCYLMVLRAF